MWEVCTAHWEGERVDGATEEGHQLLWLLGSDSSSPLRHRRRGSPGLSQVQGVGS